MQLKTHAKFITNSLHINCRDLFASPDPFSLLKQCRSFEFTLLHVHSFHACVYCSSQPISCFSHGQTASSIGHWVAGFDPPSETISPKRDKKRHKDVTSKKSKKKKKKKSLKRLRTHCDNRSLQHSRVMQFQACKWNHKFQQSKISMIQLLIFFVKSKKIAPRAKRVFLDIQVAEWPRMARSGLRCPCHYVRRHLCPVKLLADEFGFTPSTSASV